MANKFDHTIECPKDLPWQLLEDITNGFSEERIIGTGGYGVVYKGVGKSGHEIAVKKFHHMPGIDEKQFQNEFQHLKDLCHENVVRLIGKSYEEQDRLVKYQGELVCAKQIDRAICLEYLQNGSLEKHLFDEFSGLPWHGRYKIIKGISEGLKYLHEHKIYHLDLKPSNVLLDKNMLPKITDFGLSRLFSGTHQSHTTQNFIGTLGYLPPEYIERRKISAKFDVFSLGVVIMEIMTGPHGYSRHSEMSCHDSIKLVHGNWRERLQGELEDKSLLDLFCKQVTTCIEIAANCVDIDRHKRPSIEDVVHMLNDQLLGILPLQLCFPSEQDRQQMLCPMQLTNKTDLYVVFNIRPKRAECFTGLLHGTVPPRSACTYVLTIREKNQQSSDVIDGYLIECFGLNKQPHNVLCGLEFSNIAPHEVKELPMTTVTDQARPTFEITLLEEGPIIDVHPVEPGILTNDDEAGVETIEYSRKIVVVKVDLHDNKHKQKAMKAVSTLQGIDELSIDMRSQKMTVIGLMDPVQILTVLRRTCASMMFSVSSVVVEKKVNEGNVYTGQHGGIKIPEEGKLSGRTRPKFWKFWRY